MTVHKAAQDADQKKERVVTDWTGGEGKTLKLPPGLYDVTVTNHEDAGKPAQTFPGITVEAGKTVEKTADFSGGGLRISALRNGNPFSAHVTVETAGKEADQKKRGLRATGPGLQEKRSSCPWEFMM